MTTLSKKESSNLLNPPNKKVLIITYYFPPSGGAGVQRTLKFVKYLRDFGWEPVVLTVKNADYPAYDKTLQSDIPSRVKIYRSRIVEPYRLYRRFTGKRAGEATDIATQSIDARSKNQIGEQISEWIRSVFFIPDARLSWQFFGYSMGKKILREENIDVIFSSAPPYTAHLIGLKLKRFSQLPWLVDFRDSWIGWLSTPQWRPKISRAMEKHMEKSVLKEADKIVTVSYGVKDDLLSRHPELRDERWIYLPNGFDSADFENIRSKPKSKKITVTYLGSVFGSRSPEPLIRALESLKNENCPLLKKIKFRFVGRMGEPIRKRIESSSVCGLFEILPYVKHHESLAYLANSDISLLIIDDVPASRGILTGKIFEYIGVGNPIFALAPEGEAADLIRNNELGVVVAHDDIDGVKKALVQLAEAKNLLKNNSGIKKQFERREQTRQLAKVLDDLTSNVKT